MNTLNIGMHTVVILVGPSQSGKSTWVRHFSDKISEKNPHIRTSIISSDEIRHEILKTPLDRYHPHMMEASEAAFDLLFSKLESVTRFPINNEFVVVDTTGLDNDFRFKVADIARKNSYRVCVVLFDYQTGQYFENLEGFAKTVVSKQVEAFKQRVLPSIKRKTFDYSFSVKSKEPSYFEELQINIVDQALWENSYFFNPSEKPLAIIGDVHESVEGLKTLVSLIDKDSQLVFLGDLFDKGQNTVEMLDYLETLVAKGAIIVVGNHESFVARRLLGKIEAISNENDLFSSLQVFKSDKALAQRFLKLYENMLPFAVFKNYGKSIYVTHAPCYNHYLGKLGEKAQKLQRNFYFASRAHEDMLSELRFVEDEAKNSHPIHVFGHIAHAMKHMEMKNKVWLDSGAVYGRKLSALIVEPNGSRKLISTNCPKLVEGKLLVWKKTDNNQKKTENLTENIVVAPKEDGLQGLIKKYKLGADDIYWLKSFGESGAKFVSGTIAPSQSTTTELEPLKQALLYFKNKGVEQVILQPKWMGSRMQIYLHKDKSQDFAVTRSGTKAGHNQVLQPIFATLHDKFDNIINYQNQLVLDGELMPWSAIGQELIDKEFLQYGSSIQKEIGLLDIDPIFNNFGFDVKEQAKGIDTFMEQLAIHGKKCDANYKPFSVLMVDGENWMTKNQEEIYSMVSSEKYCVIDLYNEQQFQLAQTYFDNLVNDNYEGVVIKPVFYKEFVAPAIKVRNEKYLHLIYGFDYKDNYEHMCKNKRVGKKQALSIKQFDIGMKMLTATKKQDLLELACQMKFEINQEQELDPRL